MIKDIQQLVSMAKPNSKPKRVALASANDAHAVEAVLRAADDGYVDPVLIGDTATISKLISDCGHNPSEIEIIDAQDDVESAAKTIALAREGKVDMIQKGTLNTSDLLRAVLNKETGLEHDKLVTHLTLTGFPGYHKIIGLCDVAILPYPTLEQRAMQIESVARAMHAFGYGEDLKVASIAAAEGVSPKIVESYEAAELKRMNEAGEITGCIVEGPISLDLALSFERANAKGYSSPVAGDADILMFPNMVSGSVVAKILEMQGLTPIGIVLGAGVPIAVSSRAASVETKYSTLAVTTMIAR